MNELTVSRENINLESLSMNKALTPLEITTREEYDNLDGQWFIDKFINSFLNKNTRDSYSRSIKDWFTYCYGDKLITLRDMIINNSKATEYADKWKNNIRKDPNKQIEGEISISTYNSKIKGIRSFYNWIKLETRINDKDYQYIKYNPFDAVQMLDATDSVGSMSLTPEEINILLENPYGKTEHIRQRNLLIFELALVTGFRNSTLLDLKPSDIQNIDDDIIIQKYTKRHKLTRKPIDNYYERMMNWYNYDVKNRAVDNGTIFNLSITTTNETIKKWLKSCNIDKKVTFHGLRATCAILIYHDSDCNKHKVQKFLDHDEEVVTQRYLDKEHIIDYSGINALENLKKSFTKDEEPQENLNEELLKLISNLDDKAKLDMIKMMKGA